MKEVKGVLYAVTMMILLLLEYTFFGFERTVIFGLVMILVYLKDMKEELRKK